MRTGRPRKALEDLAPGSYRPSRHGDRKPTPPAPESEGPPGEALQAPAELSEDSRKNWAKLVACLGGHLAPSDLRQLRAGFTAIDTAGKIQCALDLAIVEGNAASISKLSQAVASQQGLAKRLLEGFGIDPAGRARLEGMLPPRKPKQAPDYDPKTDPDTWES